MADAPKVRVGVGVFILKNQKSRTNPTFLIGQRLNSHGAGTYALPGGHLEFGESFEACAAREVVEETGLKVKVTNMAFLTATNDYMPKDKKHYVTMYMVCEREDEKAEPQLLEPDKCRGWEWVSWEDLLGWVKRQNEANEKGNGEELERKMFAPFLNLVAQRPGVVPVLD